MTVNYDILVVDDNSDDYELCSRMLSKHTLSTKNERISFRLQCVKSGPEALAEIAVKTPHCILLDYSLPGMDGVAVLREIRKTNSSIPIIMLTGQGNENLAVTLLKSGAQDYIVKSEIGKIDFSGVVYKAIMDGKQQESEAPPVRVLIVDDNMDDREFVIRTLKKTKNQDYHFTEAESGAEIINLIEQYLPQCILLDYSLPGEDGLAVLKKITHHSPSIPVILFSGQGNEVIAAEAIKNGAFHYLVKSQLTIDTLEAAITQGIEKKSLEKVLQEKSQEIKRYQHEALDRKNRFDRVIEATGIIVWEYDIHHDHLFIDDAISVLLRDEIDNSSVTLQAWRRYIHPDDIDAVEHAWQHCLQGNEVELDISYRIRHQSGEWHWIRESGKRVADRIADSTKIVGFYEDINEKKREEDALNHFYTLTVDGSLSSDQKISKILQLGLSFLGLELSIMSKISGNDYVVTHSEPTGVIPPGEHFDYSETYCAHVFGSTAVQAWSDAGNSEICTHPCYQNLLLNTYIGTTLFVGNHAYGTLAFVKKDVREKPFSDQDKNFVRLVGKWISSEITQQINIKKIEDSERFSRLVQDSIPDLIFVKDDQFRIVRGNPAFINVYPESMRGSIIGTTTVESYNDEEAEAFLYQDKLALKEGSSETEETILFPDGRECTLHTKKIRFQDANNHSYILGISRDVTERIESEKQQNILLESLAESNNLKQAIVDSAQHLIISTDAEGVVTLFNKASQKALGYTEEEIVGNATPAKWHDMDEVVKHAQTLTQELGYDVTPGFDVFIIKAQNNISETREWSFIRKDGSRFPAQLTASCLRDSEGNITGYLGIIEDISARKEAEAEVLRSNQELERFAYVASHDLQEPLRMVTNFTQLLEKHYGDKLDGRALEYIQYASNGALRMQQLVRDLLEYARIGNVAETHEEINLDYLKSSIHENLSESIQQSGATILWPELPTVVAEPVRIFSVFQNIIGNAIKYRQPDVTPNIKIAVADSSNYWLFSISDNGIGMKQQYCEKIFEPFKRLHRKEEYSGTGMGLSICRKSIEGLGGKIWAESELGKGSTFYFTLLKIKN